MIYINKNKAKSNFNIILAKIIIIKKKYGNNKT